MPRVPAPRRPPSRTRSPPRGCVASRSSRPAAAGASGAAHVARGGSAAKPGPSGPSAAANGPQIQLIPASAEGALDAAEEAVDLLLDSGRAPRDVLVITTGEPHPWATHELSFGEASYWAQHDAGDDVFYTDAKVADRAKTRPVVVVAANGGPEPATASALKAAHARAGALLIVCGDPQRINSVLGTGV